MGIPTQSRTGVTGCGDGPVAVSLWRSEGRRGQAEEWECAERRYHMDMSHVGRTVDLNLNETKHEEVLWGRHQWDWEPPRALQLTKRHPRSSDPGLVWRAWW